VLLVAITILAYNLVPPAISNGQVNQDELKVFYNNLYGLVSSFMVISIFWIFSMNFFDYLKYPDELIVMILVTFFVLILLTPMQDLASSSSSSIVTSCQFDITNIFCLALGKMQESAEQRIGQTSNEENVCSVNNYPFTLCHLRRVIIREF
jgi:uncharacterized membrane protein